MNFDLADQGHILLPMVDYVAIHVKITSKSFLQSIDLVHEIFKCICTMPLTFNLESQGHILVWVSKATPYDQQFVSFHDLSAVVL